jgi:hypothetical protein
VARLARTLLTIALLLGAAIAAYIYGRDYVRRHPQDFPWTRLSLRDPIGPFTSRKLAALASDTPQCRMLLRDAGAVDEPAPARQSGPDCGYADGTRLVAREGEPGFSPAGLVTSCPVAAALTIWEQQVLKPAAARHFGSQVTAITHAGSYSCRRIYGREYGNYSEHARANAVDITGFRLADGTRITVLADWSGNSSKSAFLRDVRDGACRLFATTLSPDYNPEHRDHLHLDLARRGEFGGSLCS